MATSKIIKNSSGLNYKTIWSNPNPDSPIDARTIATGDTGQYNLIVVIFHQYASQTSYYYLNNVYVQGVNGQGFVSTWRFDGSTGYQMGRNANYDFTNNRLTITDGYRQDTYRTSTKDNNVLIPVKILAFY